MQASYLVHDEGPGDPLEKVPELSRRARGVPVWAALRSLGRSGVAELIDRLVRQAQALADGIATIDGAEVLNDVELNQVLFRFATDDETNAALRAAIDLTALGENSISIDCDVIQADGGTRTAAITGAYVALADAVAWLGAKGALAQPKPLVNSISAVSVGVIDGEPRLDLMYEEDVRAETDMNVVLTGGGDFVEVQGTAEGVPFRRDELDALLDLALAGCAQLTMLQQEALGG